MKTRRVSLVLLAAFALAACLDGESGNPPVARIDVAGDPFVGETVVLDGSRSYDPDNGADGAITGYIWRLTTAPEGSTATLTTSGDASTASMAPDEPGAWEIELVVVDRSGLASSPASIRITVEEDGPGPAPTPTPTPPAATPLIVESDWSNNGDLDVHLIHVTAGGSFMQPPYDCFSANPNPEWGPEGDPGDCQVVVDAQAYGTEKVVVATPEMGATYRVTVWNYSNQGGTNVHVRIKLGDEIVFDDSVYLSTPGYGWHAAEITYPFSAVEVIDQTFIWY